jgi:hypothetical protein
MLSYPYRKWLFRWEFRCSRELIESSSGVLGRMDCVFFKLTPNEFNALRIVMSMQRNSETYISNYCPMPR